MLIKFTKKSICINSKQLFLSSLIWFILPIFIFLVSWIKLIIALPFTIALLIACVAGYKRIEKYTFDISLGMLCSVVVISAAALIFTGMGGLFVQTWDNHTKNAIFRDLIELPWPINYTETGNILVYYLTYWLVPALFGKVLGWQWANFFLLMWSAIGLINIFLWMICFFKKKNCQINYVRVICLFFAWSGLNILGELIVSNTGILNSLKPNGGEGWLDGSINGHYCGYLYRSIWDCMQQTYNQAIPSWLCLLMLINIDDVSFFVLIGSPLFAYSPIAFIGILPLFLGKYIMTVKAKKKVCIKEEVVSIFGLANILSGFSIGFIYYMYYSCNSYSQLQLYIPFDIWNADYTVALLLFYLLEFGGWTILIMRTNRKNVLFWICLFEFLLIPLLGVGGGRDFCMNASIPGIAYLFILFVKKMSEESNKARSYTKVKILMISVFIIGAITPVSLLAKDILSVHVNQPVVHYADNTYTLRDKNLGDELQDTWVEFYLVKEKDSFFYNKLMK